MKIIVNKFKLIILVIFFLTLFIVYPKIADKNPTAEKILNPIFGLLLPYYDANPTVNPLPPFTDTLFQLDNGSGGHYVCATSEKIAKDLWNYKSDESQNDLYTRSDSGNITIEKNKYFYIINLIPGNTDTSQNSKYSRVAIFDCNFFDPITSKTFPFPIYETTDTPLGILKAQNTRKNLNELVWLLYRLDVISLSGFNYSANIYSSKTIENNKNITRTDRVSYSGTDDTSGKSSVYFVTYKFVLDKKSGNVVLQYGIFNPESKPTEPNVVF